MSSFLGFGAPTNSTEHEYRQPDFSAFAIDEDDEDEAATADDSHSRPTPASVSNRSQTEGAGSTTLPGGYDFEPQGYEGGGGGSAFHSRPTSLSQSRNPSVPRERDSYEETESGDTRGGLPLWSRIRARLPGASADSSSTTRGGGTQAESNRLLFSQDESDEQTTDGEGRGERGTTTGYPPRNIHLPLPARPPTFAPPASTPNTSNDVASTSVPMGGRVYGGGSSNDGVFSNLAAKPEGSTNLDVIGEGPDKDEVLPAYEAAALDSTPPYWETTVITPGSFLGPDDICVDGMPVGNLFSFAWNLLVSMSFQFVGFLLTYLLHTTHAAKNGSRAGLGITLIQLGFYLKQHTDHSGDPLFDDGAAGSRDETGLNGNAGPRIDNVRWSWWGGEIEEIDPASTPTPTSFLGTLPTQVSNSLSGVLEASNGTKTSAIPSLMGNGGASEQELNAMSMATNEWMSFALVTVGSFLLIGGCLSYWRAVRYARAMRQGQGPGADNENMIAVS